MCFLNFVKRDHFDKPIFLDSLNQIGKVNGFIDDFHVQCFLLDQEKRVLAIGNPTQNGRLWEYYKGIVQNKNNSLTVK